MDLGETVMNAERRMHLSLHFSAWNRLSGCVPAVFWHDMVGYHVWSSVGAQTRL